MPAASTPPSAWQHFARRRDLWWQFTIRAIEMKHRGSYLGIIWTVVNPLLMMGLYLFVFGTIFGGSYHALPDETKLDYAFGLFLGLTFFNVLAETISIAPSLIVTNPNLVKKVVFPLEVLPIDERLTQFFLAQMMIPAKQEGRSVSRAVLDGDNGTIMAINPQFLCLYTSDRCRSGTGDRAQLARPLCQWRIKSICI
jgi:hypothetical protein